MKVVQLPPDTIRNVHDNGSLVPFGLLVVGTAFILLFVYLEFREILEARQLQQVRTKKTTPEMTQIPKLRERRRVRRKRLVFWP